MHCDGNPKLLIIGAGSIGERHLRCALHTNRVDLAVCEINDDLRRTVATRYHISHAYSNLDAAISFCPTAAAICVPAHLHVPIAIRLVEAGIHVLIEKPLSTNLEGVYRLLQAVSNSNVVAAVGYVQRADPSLIALRNALRSGHFGRPMQLIAVAGQNFPLLRPGYLSSYYTHHNTGGGAIHDALTHLINIAEWNVGPIDRIIADAAHRFVPGVEVEDTVHAMARHQNVLASYAINQYQAPNEITLTVICEQGTLRWEFHQNRWRWMMDSDNSWHNEPGLPYDRDLLFERQLSTFFDAFEYGKEPLCSLADGIRSLQTNMAIFQSLKTGEWVEPPDINRAFL